MGCLLPVFAIFAPRFVMIFIFILTDWFAQAYETRMYPFLGWLIMPYTTLAYMAAMLQNNHELKDGWLVLLIFAVIFDLGGQTESAKGSKK